MGEHLEEIGFEHPGGVDEEPVRRVDHLQIGLMVHVPHLRQEGLIRVDHALDLFLERAHHHRVGHHQRKWVMRLHFLGDIFGAVVEDEPAPPGWCLAKLVASRT